MDQAAELLHVALAGAVSTAPAPKNSRLLNSEWLNTWSSAGGERERGRPSHAMRLERQCQPERGEDDADVLDGADRPGRA